MGAEFIVEEEKINKHPFAVLRILVFFYKQNFFDYTTAFLYFNPACITGVVTIAISLHVN